MGHGASGRWRACVGPATCPMHICVRARVCAFIEYASGCGMARRIMHERTNVHAYLGEGQIK